MNCSALANSSDSTLKTAWIHIVIPPLTGPVIVGKYFTHFSLNFFLCKRVTVDFIVLLHELSMRKTAMGWLYGDS